MEDKFKEGKEEVWFRNTSLESTYKTKINNLNNEDSTHFLHTPYLSISTVSNSRNYLTDFFHAHIPLPLMFTASVCAFSRCENETQED